MANIITCFRILCSIMLVFLLPLTVFLIEMKYSAMAVCSIATFSAIQEGYYIREGREIV